ncbi:D-allose-binding periplasmic protein precursor [Rubripirellula tenax]|uniref:D-allose-binding periplasmic protein n=1 Tax=Rubripirellula tenax TaxID=2528015 RepID=A0A5C6F064_9BACT|nr:sugar ABC transporter substrate-binding protein [Rubripirellula tenax]TWU54672.1 D-allose-binding periplasmic protein precursor [Rubripirellula tenax]
MNRTTLFSLLFAGLVLAFVGCGPKSASTSVSKPATESDSTSGAGKPRIALIMKSLANEFFSTMEAGAKAHQSDHSDEYELLTNGIKDESDLGRQVALVGEMVAGGVDAIVIAPADSKALVPALRKAKKAGVVVVNIDNRLDADILKQEDVAIAFVGPDNRSGAKQVGDFLAKSLFKGDKVAVLEGKATAFNGVERRLGFEAAMKEAGVEIVSSQSADWETNKANAIAASMISEFPEIKAILAANDSMALGAVAAIKAAGRTGEIQVVGFDNIGAVGQLIVDGKVLATADQHGDQLAVFGIETALAILKDPAASTDDVQTPVDLVTAETLAR